MRRLLAASMALMLTTSAHATLESAASFLPNSVGADLSQDQTDVALEEREGLTGRPVSPGGTESSLRHLSRISVTKISPPPTGRLRLSFAWVPVATFAFQNLRYDSTSAFITETKFQMFRTSLGVGPEARLNLFGGILAANIVPGAAYSWVSWSSPVSGGSMARPNVNLAASIGYERFLTRSIALKVFGRRVWEDTGVWNEAFSSSQGFEVPVKSVATSVIGISLSYVFF